MNYNPSLNICEFFSVCSQLILEAGKIIHETFDPKNLQVQIKNGSEPFTEADVKVQTLIIKGLKSCWPNLNIIAEEEETYKGDFSFDFDSLETDLVPESLFKGLKSLEVNIEDAIVWIDPIDGTSEFIQGYLHSVTTLIGVSIKGESKIGIIGKYFDQGKKGYKWSPRCYFAHADNPHLYFINYKNEKEVLEVSQKSLKEKEGLSICTSKSRHALKEFGKYFKKINPDEIIQAGGAGNKVLLVVEGQNDCYFYPRAGMKKWDICAGEAILRSIGGIVTDSTNEIIQYKEEKSTWNCFNGVIASISSEKHSRVVVYLL